MEFFHASGASESFRQAITRFQDSCMTKKLSPSSSGGTVWHTKSLYSHLNKLKLETYDSSEEVGKVVA
jgi:hypothetical protein